MKFSIALANAFLCSSAVFAADHRTEKNVYPTQMIGEAHGSAFDDWDATGSLRGQHLRISGIAMACGRGDYLYAIEVSYRDNKDPKVPVTSVTHGRMPHPDSPDYYRMDFDKDEYIVELWLDTWKTARSGVHGGRTRVGFMNISTNKPGRMLYCGRSFIDTRHHDLPKDGALLHFSGSQGNAIDAIGGHWIPTADF